jgi:hypothetical protein
MMKRKLFILVALLSCLVLSAPTVYADAINTDSPGAVANDNDTNDVDNTNTGINDQSQLQVGGSPSATITTHGSEIPRSFPVPGSTNYPGYPQYFGQSTEDYNFQKAGVMLLFKKVWTRAELEAMVGGRIKVNSKSLVPLKEKKDRLPEDTIEIIIKRPQYPVQQVGLIYVTSKNVDSTSMEVLSKAALSALDMGAKTLFLTAEGYSRVIKAFGWGVGLNYTQAWIQKASNNQNNGGVGSGGTGISGGEAGYRSKPWIQMFALKPLAE